jgi:hypothetical protein
LAPRYTGWGDAAGGQTNPRVNAGPVVVEDKGAPRTPWLGGAALLVVLVPAAR